MPRISRSNLGAIDLVQWIKDLRARVERLELLIGMRAVMFAPLGTSVSSTSFESIAFTLFPRSGSSLAVDVSVGGAVEVQAVVDGVPIGTAASTGSGAVTVTGFLPESWAFGDRKRVEIRARRTSGSGEVSTTVLGGWHR